MMEMYSEELDALVAEFKALAKKYPKGNAPSKYGSEIKCAGLLACLFASGLAAISCGVSRAALALMTLLLFYLADLHSGLAHVMLDDERTYGVAALFRAGVLEFNAHHEFSRDLVVRNKYDVMFAPIRDGGPAQVLATLIALAFFPERSNHLTSSENQMAPDESTVMHQMTAATPRVVLSRPRR